MRAAKEVKRRDNSLEALSTTPGGGQGWTVGADQGISSVCLRQEK